MMRGQSGSLSPVVELVQEPVLQAPQFLHKARETRGSTHHDPFQQDDRLGGKGNSMSKRRRM